MSANGGLAFAFILLGGRLVPVPVTAVSYATASAGGHYVTTMSIQ